MQCMRCIHGIYTTDLYGIWHVIVLMNDVQYVAISVCRMRVGKTIKKVKCLKWFGTLFHCYEFGLSLAE